MIFNMIVGGGSGNAGLNFSVKAYASEDLLPATAEVNTIAVFTTTEITSYIFNATEPEAPADGETPVWFITSTYSPVAFNALKENCIRVCPIVAKQYIDGAWTTVVAKIYQDDKWNGWFDGNLFKYGDQCEAYTGGWIKPKDGNPVTVSGTTMSADATWTVSSYCSGLSTAKKIDITGYSTLNANITELGRSGFIMVSTDSTNVPVSNQVMVACQSSDSTGIISLDLSTVAPGEYYIILTAGVGGGQDPAADITVDRVWLE